MELAIEIVINTLLPILEKDSNFDRTKTTASFWESFTKALADFESDPKPLYALVYSLELADAEKVISKLPKIYSLFINELAENYVLGKSTEMTAYLLQSGNKQFAKDVTYFKKLELVIRKVERKRIKNDLPSMNERLTFELTDADIALATKKKGREDLKAKFKQWDTEMKIEEVPVINISSSGSKSEKETKVISLSWMKYAVAACLVLGLGIWFFNQQNQSDTEVKMVTAPEKKEPVKEPEIVPEITTEALAEISTKTSKVKVLQNTSLGFTTTENSSLIEIVFKDVSERIASLEKSIKTQSNTEYEGELKDLKSKNDHYFFDGKSLTIYSKFSKENLQVIQLDNNSFYLNTGTDFVKLKTSKLPQPLKVETDTKIIEALEKISFENE